MVMGVGACLTVVDGVFFFFFFERVVDGVFKTPRVSGLHKQRAARPLLEILP